MATYRVRGSGRGGGSASSTGPSEVDSPSTIALKESVTELLKPSVEAVVAEATTTVISNGSILGESAEEVEEDEEMPAAPVVVERKGADPDFAKWMSSLAGDDSD